MREVRSERRPGACGTRVWHPARYERVGVPTRRLRNAGFCEILGFQSANSLFSAQQNRRETVYNGAKLN